MGSNPDIEAAIQEPARQDTQRQPQVMDATGLPLRHGDEVLIRARVEWVDPGSPGCNVGLVTVKEMPSAYGFGPHRSPIHLNSQQVVRVT